MEIDILIQEATQLVAHAGDALTDEEEAKTANDARTARQQHIASLQKDINDSLAAIGEHRTKIENAAAALKDALGSEGDQLADVGTKRRRHSPSISAIGKDSTSLDLLFEGASATDAAEGLDAVSILKYRSRNGGFTSPEARDAAVTEAATRGNDGSDHGLEGLDAVSIMKLRSQNGGHLPGERGSR